MTTTLIEQMREELIRRNYAETTIYSYTRAVRHFAHHIAKPLDQLGPDDLRSYHAHLLRDKKLTVNTFVLNILRASIPVYQDPETPGYERGSSLSQRKTSAAGDPEPRRSS